MSIEIFNNNEEKKENFTTVEIKELTIKEKKYKKINEIN